MPPRTGLNVPIITALDETGEIIEEDQRRVIRYVVQRGHGADSVFISGTTGEFNRITNDQRRRLLEIGVEEVRSINAQLPDGNLPVEAWAGVTASTKAETIQNLDLAAQLKADMAVIAPLAIGDLAPYEIVRFFERDVAQIVGSDEPLPIGLYDNAEIAAAPDVMANLPVACIEELSRLPFVVCLKASTTREVLQSYMNTFAADDGAERFGVYVGNAPLIFEMDEIQRGADIEPHRVGASGVVSGTANLFPREWQGAWRAVVAHEAELCAAYRSAFADFEDLTFFGDGRRRASKLIAGIKQGMYSRGIISSPSVARGTPMLTPEEAEQLTDGLARVTDELRNKVHPQFLSVYP
ncbi:MAG TPA: dihydrodipicolinate synthase family protein [Pyrinomonadaceae bacterium]|nr:dihydrodipicolinate synthase family protein [Pyrinomonadaceae bacterium]